MPISLLNLSRYSSLANICLSKAFLHLGAWSYQSKGSISRGYNWIFITTKYNNINGGISIIHVYWSSQQPTFFNNTLLINLALSQNYKQQMKLYWLEYYYIKPWQSHAPSSKPWKSHAPSSKLWWSHALQYWNHNGLMHHTVEIFENVILHLGAWSLIIYLRRLHIDLHEDQPLHQLNQSYYSSYGTLLLH